MLVFKRYFAHSKKSPGKRIQYGGALRTRMGEDDKIVDGSGQVWSAYSEYKDQSQQVAEKVSRANDAYSFLVSVYTQDMHLPEKSAMDTKRALLNAGMRLKPEIKMNNEHEPFDEIWERWDGEEGYIQMLIQHDFYNGMPGWVHQYSDDLMTAAWEIGYLQAGRQEAADPDSDDAKISEVID